jgi:hypothetical protein
MLKPCGISFNTLLDMCKLGKEISRTCGVDNQQQVLLDHPTLGNWLSNLAQKQVTSFGSLCFVSNRYEDDEINSDRKKTRTGT